MRTGLLEPSPMYTLARYNRSCAMARLGATTQALREMERVLCEDLPTYLPKALADNDLESLHPSLEELRISLEAEYQTTYAASDSVMMRGELTPRDPFSGHPRFGRWGQLARYVGGRFVPIGPRVTHSVNHEYSPVMVSAMQTDSGVVTVSSSSINADARSWIDTDVTVVMTEPGTGVEIARWESPLQHRRNRETTLTHILVGATHHDGPGLLVAT